MVITAADLAGVKPIKPMLHKFNYVPVAQPILADGVVRFVGEPVAAVVAPSKEEAEDIADLVEVEIAPLTAGRRCAARARRTARQRFMPKRRRMSSWKARIKTPNFDATRGGGAYRDQIRGAARAGRTPRRWRRGPGMRPTTPRPAASRSTCTTQMPHLTRTAIADLLGMPEADLRVIAPDVGGGFGQKMSLPPEYVIAGLAGAPVAQLGGLDRGPAGKI